MEAAVQLLRCSPMATDVPQRELRNRTADLLRRVEAGERLRITVHGHPVAELVPIEEERYPRRFVPLKKFEELAGMLTPEQGRAWVKEIREIRNESLVRDPYEKYEELRRERKAQDDL
jgi:prevent-host-death family protein